MPYFEPSGLLVRRLLIEERLVNPYRVHRVVRGKGFKASYQNIRNLFYWLRRLGLIKAYKVGRPSKPHLQLQHIIN
jgi:hypothetical protein